MTVALHQNATGFRLRDGVEMRPVASLRKDIRAQVNCGDEDIAVTSLGGRLRSLIVEPDAAEFLAEFRETSTIVAASARYCLSHMPNKRQGEAFQALVERACATGLLERVDASLVMPIDWAAVDIIDGLKVARLIQSMEDTAVLLVRNISGESLALKIAQNPQHKTVELALEHETDVLRRVAEPVAAGLRAEGTFRDRRYLATRWFNGLDILSVANQHRAEKNNWAALLKIFRTLVLNLLERYVELHQLGIVHGDIHPKNILVDPLGEILLVDFALARVVSGESPFGPLQRNGVPYFFEPAYATAYLEGGELPAASIATDVHGLAALIFMLVSGAHYVRFRYEREHFLRQIVHEPVRSFAELGLNSVPEVEHVLERALGRGALPGFSSIAALRDALTAASWVPQEAAPRSPPPVLPRLMSSGADFYWPLRAPGASAHFGAAGIALALLRKAELHNDAATLADAAAWNARAIHWRGPGGFISLDRGISEDSARAGALHFGAFGVDVIDALVSLAHWDTYALNSALRRLCTRGVSAGSDLVSGRAGQLLGCALLIEAIAPDPLILAREEVVDFGGSLIVELQQELATAERVSRGIAHGTAGVAYALLRWKSVTVEPPGSSFFDLLDALSQTAINQAPDNRFSASWCNGSAGLTHLCCQAFEYFGDEVFLHRAIVLGDRCLMAQSAGPSLCCGDSGIAYAQLTLFRLLNDKQYLNRARVLAERACRASGLDDTSLYKGRVGIDLLMLELEQPLQARMPLFEARGWPRRAQCLSREAGLQVR